MTAEEEFRFWNYYLVCRDTQRKGQALMNALRYIAPELYEMVTGTVADCFYQDDKIPAFAATTGLTDSAMQMGLIRIPNAIRSTWR